MHICWTERVPDAVGRKFVLIQAVSIRAEVHRIRAPEVTSERRREKGDRVSEVLQENAPLFLFLSSFPYVCPEPVLVKGSFLV